MRFLRNFFLLASLLFSSATWASESFSIIPRTLWGADETLRYVDNPAINLIYKASLGYLASPKTQDQIDTIQNEQNRLNQIKSVLGSAGEIVHRQYNENGHTLYLPIEKTKQVSRIVIHHEGVVLGTSATDDQIIRTIYKNHVMKGWGDIAYHYIIGQRGQIYEGRAGGDYVVGTHALSNNLGTVGIVVLGNYTENVLNRDQIAGIKKLVPYLAKKYGITLSARAVGFECPDSECKILNTLYTESLLGHRDVKNTNCPGDNIYPLIPDWIKELDRAYTPVLNPATPHIEDTPQERMMNLTPITTSISVPSAQDIRRSIASSIKKVQYVGKKFKVKISYPDEKNITLSFVEGGVKAINLGSRKIRVGTGEKIEVGIVGNDRLEIKIGKKKYQGKSQDLKIAGNVIRIDSWLRIPAWDSAKRYNDNLFRDTIVVRNVDGKLLVVNELPLEWYLKGMGEVSNSEMPEKIKTIVVAARSYAKYYMSPQNRKYNTKLYDGSDDPDSFQKYLGYGYEARSPNVSTQVDNTRGLVVTYNRKPIKPWYFSSSSGKTLSYTEYCKNTGKSDCTDIPYLQSVDDPGGYGHTQAGHGVGISGVGATYWAGQGWDYKKIINYYLPGTKVEKK